MHELAIATITIALEVSEALCLQKIMETLFFLLSECLRDGVFGRFNLIGTQHGNVSFIVSHHKTACCWIQAEAHAASRSIQDRRSPTLELNRCDIGIDREKLYLVLLPFPKTVVNLILCGKLVFTFPTTWIPSIRHHKISAIGN